MADRLARRRWLCRDSFTRSVVTAVTRGREKQRPAPVLAARADVKAKTKAKSPPAGPRAREGRGNCGQRSPIRRRRPGQAVAARTRGVKPNPLDPPEPARYPYGRPTATDRGRQGTPRGRPREHRPRPRPPPEPIGDRDRGTPAAPRPGWRAASSPEATRSALDPGADGPRKIESRSGESPPTANPGRKAEPAAGARNYVRNPRPGHQSKSESQARVRLESGTVAQKFGHNAHIGTEHIPDSRQLSFRIIYLTCLYYICSGAVRGV